MNDSTVSKNLKSRYNQKRQMNFRHKGQTKLMNLDIFIQVHIGQMFHKDVLQKWGLLINDFIVLRNKNGWVSFKF